MTAQLAIQNLNEFMFGHAPRPLTCGRGVELGSGTVVPEINFTLPPISIEPANWAAIRAQYKEMAEAVCRRAVDLHVPALVMEFETLPPMTVEPELGIEISQLLAGVLDLFHERHGLRSALRLTPNDTREHSRPPRMRSGPWWDGMRRMFRQAGEARADLLSIESTGGKEISDEALMNVDLRGLAFALGVLAARDMEFLWTEIVDSCRGTSVIPAGDTACGFANTAMTLAEQRYIPRLFAALVRVATVPRSLIAYELGARGPSKDCGYEGPYMKAIAGVPISMEGRSSACAHLSPLGNIAQAVCDCWSNESVQNLRLLSGSAPVVSMEQLAYDCRLCNATEGAEDGRRLRDLLARSDASLDTQAFVLRPDVVLELSAAIMAEQNPYRRTRVAILATLDRLRRALAEGEVQLPANERPWLDRFQKQADDLPESEETLCEEMAGLVDPNKCLLGEYGLPMGAQV